MKRFFVILLVYSLSQYMYAQGTSKNYAHKVTVDSVFQTRAYTYLKVKEKVKEKDSLLWMALPNITAKSGDVFYYESGMAMGKFTSKELSRTFDQILFLATVSTSLDVNEKTILPLPVVDTAQANMPPLVAHTVVLKEVLDAGGYIYLRVMEGKTELWLAIVKVQVKVGQTYHYDDASLMKNFYSKELKRTFPEIYFLAKLSIGPAPEEQEAKLKDASSPEAKKRQKALSQSAKTIPSIANLLENRKEYAGKKVMIKGEVTKYSSNILGKNWVHITDGPKYVGKSDLVLTTDQELKVGDKVSFEGILSIDKDFGSGYFFQEIIEEATVQK